MNYCVVKDNNFFVGTKEEIVHQVCSFHIDELRRLQVQFNGFNSETCCSYSKEYTDKEMYIDIIICLFNRIKRYGYTMFQEVN